MHVTRLGFDYPAAPDSHRTDLRFGSPQLCQVGRLVGCKGQSVAIEAVARLQQEFPGVALVLVGAGPRESELRALAVARGVGERVLFVGQQKAPLDYVLASDGAGPSKAEASDWSSWRPWLRGGRSSRSTYPLQTRSCATKSQDCLPPQGLSKHMGNSSRGSCGTPKGSLAWLRRRA
ncbi:MAG: glycosyltransferase [Sandaracinaceae bacterium]|nr:glycosyltransferase [Sandaracinaceae bacterium]